MDKMLVTVDIVLFTVEHETLKVLLVQRKFEPWKNLMVIPGGFVRLNEDLEKAAKRELFEETGVNNIYMEQLYTFGNSQRDPRGRVITVTYYSLIDSTKIKLKASTDAKNAKWFPISKVSKLGFDHNLILDYAIKRLRNKLNYTTIAFQLLPQLFTLTELQKLYEIILDRKLDKRNFRKKLLSLDILDETRESKMEGAHRPAKLYKFKKKSLVFGRDIV